MPRNFKEGMVFTSLMCSMMVIGMSSWNLWLSGHFSVSHIAIGFIPGFIVAVLADLLIAARIAKPAAFKSLACLNRNKNWDLKKELVVKVLLITFFMVLVMVTLMSFYGIFVRGLPFSLATYFKTWFFNFLMGFPLNLIIVGPLSRFILSLIQARSVAR